ncbi:hypothetical protein V1524DRAFT_170180 [Lipomyces starkeyi]
MRMGFLRPCKCSEREIGYSVQGLPDAEIVDQGLETLCTDRQMIALLSRKPLKWNFQDLKLVGKSGALLCNVHAMRTLKRRLNTAATNRCQRHIISAIVSKPTEVGCDNEIELALRAAPTDHDRQYTGEEWKDRKKCGRRTLANIRPSCYRSMRPTLISIA